MSDLPSFDDILAVMATVSMGQANARVPLPDDSRVEDVPTRFAIALNGLLDDLSSRSRAAEQLAARLRILADAARDFSAATQEPERLLDTIARRLTEVVADQCVVLLLSQNGRELVPAVTRGFDEVAEQRARELFAGPFPLDGDSLAKRVHERGESFVAATLDHDEIRQHSRQNRYDQARAMGLHSLMMVPLRIHSRSLGQLVLSRYRAESPAFDAHDKHLAEALADHAAIAIANAHSYAAERAARELAQRATHARRDAEARFTRLSDSGLIGILVVDRKKKIIVEANDTVLELTGYSRDELLSERFVWTDLSPAEWHEADARAADQLVRSGIAGLREKEFLHKSGRRVPVLVGTAMIGGSSNESISFILDLTERKAANAAIEQLRQEQAAEQQRAHLAAIVDASDDAIIGKTLDGVITSWNDGARRLFGYMAHEIVGRSITLLIPDGREPEETTILQALARGEVKRFDTVRRRNDGRVIAVSVTSSPVRDAAGRVVGVSKVARDITDRRRSEDALARAKEAAEASSRELEAFSYSVAHDLRAPLRGMNGFAQLLLDGYGEKFDDEGRDWLSEILLNAKKMASLIDALLSLSRVTRSELRRESIELSKVVRATGAQLAASEPHRTVEWVVQDHLRADLDPHLARALVENLVGNAWKFTAKTRDARIEFGVSTKDGIRAFYVRDNGAGFDMAYANKLFSPFQRLHTTQEFDGTGIGLATVQRIVRRHGGRIWADGIVDGGATFWFSVPAVQQERPE